MRTFERTHPWISFTANMREAPPQLWLLLGEARSKCDHIAGVPLRPDTATRLHNLFMAKGVLGTTAIEGNTLSEDEVVKHLEGHLRLPPSKQYLAQEIQNIIDACNDSWQRLADGSGARVTVEAIKAYNAQVLRGLSVGDDVVPGELRAHSVIVGNYRGAPAEDCQYLMEKLCDWLNGPSFAANESMPSMRIPLALLEAILAHLYIAWIHPFGDGNGRTARMLEFHILCSAGVPTPAAHLLSNHYNETRSEYYRQLDKAHRSGGNVLDFVQYAVQGFVDGLSHQLEIVREQQWDITWRNYVHERFKDRRSPSDIRRRNLALDLSLSSKPVSRDQLTGLTPRLAQAYASKTEKTLARDLSALIEMKLVEKSEAGYSARREMILAFLPRRAPVRAAGSEDSPPQSRPSEGRATAPGSK